MSTSARTMRTTGLTLCSTHSPPPEGVCIGVEVCVAVLLCQVDKEGGEDQHQKADVPSSNQLLRGTHTHKDRYQSRLSVAAAPSSLANMPSLFPSSHLASAVTQQAVAADTDS